MRGRAQHLVLVYQALEKPDSSVRHFKTSTSPENSSSLVSCVESESLSQVYKGAAGVSVLASIEFFSPISATGVDRSMVMSYDLHTCEFLSATTFRNG